mmetsp:Transcript_6799/g.10730  ORF Transcript_6799/g.10730 Transcript_6799/m.10730 type:complete len:99 (-) Transcript_6799:156-452(-)
MWKQDGSEQSFRGPAVKGVRFTVTGTLLLEQKRSRGRGVTARKVSMAVSPATKEADQAAKEVFTTASEARFSATRTITPGTQSRLQMVTGAASQKTQV